MYAASSINIIHQYVAMVISDTELSNEIKYDIWEDIQNTVYVWFYMITLNDQFVISILSLLMKIYMSFQYMLLVIIERKPFNQNQCKTFPADSGHGQPSI